MSTPSSPSLRERKKAETWSAIHETAASLVLERGFEHTTVEAIAESAGVSPRTFFNYFQSKEDAVLGMHAPTLDPALLVDLRPDNDLLAQVTKLLVTVTRSSYEGGNKERRRQLIQQFPSLSQRKRERVFQAEELVRQALTELLAADPQWSQDPSDYTAEDQARMLVMLAGVPLRFAVSSPDFTVSAELTAENLDSSLTLFHRIQRKLS